MADTARLKYSITATDESSATLKKVGKNIDDLGKNAGKNIDLGGIADSLSIGGMGDMLGGALGAGRPGRSGGGRRRFPWELGKRARGIAARA
ncbi:MAG: hypothetical protein IPM07_26320 [Anaerolineales bacterium]|nr:hypothetical protein [Anaerolineales bacterium]